MPFHHAIWRVGETPTPLTTTRLAEYFVRVNRLDVREATHAVNEVGLFGNQNTVCKPTTPKWRHSVERLKTKLLNSYAQ